MARDLKIKCKVEGCKVMSANPYQAGNHRRIAHPELLRGRGGKKTGAITSVPAELKGTPKGDAIEVLLESRQVNADEVARIDRAIAGILEGK